jgi:hypothetical protein
MSEETLFGLNSMAFVNSNPRTKIPGGNKWSRSRLSKKISRRRYSLFASFCLDFY